MNIVFDLDGTLADDSHRKHYLDRDPKDWNGFYDACDGDNPAYAMMDLMYVKQKL